MSFRAFQVEKTDTGFVRSVVDREVDQLPQGELLIDVHYSSLNYKDALSATGNPGVTRVFPHTPGIDAAGVVINSNDSDFAEGDQVIVIGFDLGMGTAGGFAQRIRVPAGWAVKMPEGLDARTSMRIGTAGFTAAECVQKLEQSGMTPASGPVLVTGAGKADQHEFLRSLGAVEFMTREEAAEGAEKPLLPERWGGVVDTVGGDILFNAVKSLRYGCSAAACGLVAAPNFAASVLPFILRHVNLLGIDSVQLPITEKAAIWSRLATDWQMDLADLEETLTLNSLSDAIDRILAGQMVGRGVVDLSIED